VASPEIGKGLGLIVRGDRTGLGELSRSFNKVLKPEKVLGIDMGPHRPYPSMFFEYGPEATVVNFPPQPEQFLKWIEGLEVIFSFETFYDPQFIELARLNNIRTVLMPMPEYLPNLANPYTEGPDLYILPTPYMKDQFDLLKFPNVVIPPPFDEERFFVSLKDGEPARYEAKHLLHVIGRFAKADRAGTRILIEAIPYINHECELTIKVQGQPTAVNLPEGRYNKTYVHINYFEAHDNRMLYEDHHDALIHPRRYAGLSLPFNEAASLGLPIIALNREPENTVLPPAALVDCSVDIQMESQCGLIDVYSADPRKLAAKINELLENTDDFVPQLSHSSLSYAESLKWANLVGKYQEALHPVNSKKTAQYAGN
jgi:glycosyltransferase involved in cell wall biosynthesis